MQAVCGALMTKLRDSFSVKNLGKLSDFLGIKVTDTDSGIALTRAKYAADLSLSRKYAQLQGYSHTDVFIREA